MIKNVQANAETALNNYEEFKSSMGETLDKMIDVLADKVDTKKYKKTNGLDAIEEDDEY